MDQSQGSFSSPYPVDHRSGHHELTNHFLRTRPEASYLCRAAPLTGATQNSGNGNFRQVKSNRCKSFGVPIGKIMPALRDSASLRWGPTRQVSLLFQDLYE
jgi:hypothetical protein